MTGTAWSDRVLESSKNRTGMTMMRIQNATVLEIRPQLPFLLFPDDGDGNTGIATPTGPAPWPALHVTRTAPGHPTRRPASPSVPASLPALRSPPSRRPAAAPLAGA